MFPNVIDGDGLRMRMLTPADAEALFAFVNLPEVMEPTSSEGWTPESMDQFLRDNVSGAQLGTWCRYAIVLAGSNTPVGSLGLFNIDRRNQRAEIGYDLSPAVWGQGVMTRAAGSLIGWAFTNGLHRIEATVMDGNERSSAVLRRLGFEREGRMKDYKLVRGQFRDYWMWGLTADMRR